MNRQLVGILVAITVLPWLSGCAQMQDTQSRLERQQAAAIEWRDRALARASSAAVIRTPQPRLAGEEVSLRQQARLPEALSRSFTYASQGGQSLGDVLETLAASTGVAIRSGHGLLMPGPFDATQSAGPMASPVASPLAWPVVIDYRGSVQGLLDELAARYDISWRFHPASQSIEFFRYETRSLSLHLPAGSKALTAAISLAGVSGAGSAGGASGGAGSVAVSQSLQINPWVGIMAGIQTILGQPPGAAATAGAAGGGTGAAGSQLSVTGVAGRASANPELGLLTVTARPAALDRVAAYVDSINARFAQNVLIDIKVYSLALDQQAALGFSLDALYSRLGHYGVSVVGAAPLQAATGTPGQLTIRASDPASRWNGSQLFAQALSQFGQVALQTQGQVLAINGQPSPIQVANEVNYLAASATSAAANVGTTSTLTPGSRVVGFTANFLPLILGDSRILLQYQMQISALTALTQASSGGNSIQTPQIASQSLQQQAFVRDGQAIVLFGFDQSRDTLDSSVGLGGASRASHGERQLVVIVMQVSAGNQDG
jgi:type IVB pilus formation R64 PilN family outer membrane protein